MSIRCYENNGWTKGPIQVGGTLCASGICGLSNSMYVFDGESCVCNKDDMSVRQRRALAEHMIGLWKQFAAPVKRRKKTDAKVHAK